MEYNKAVMSCYFLRFWSGHVSRETCPRVQAEADPLIAVVSGGGVSLYNSVGSGWTADDLKIFSQPEVDFHSNIASKARAKITYERLMNLCDDPDTKDALQFLMSREITHMNAFELVLGSLGKGRLEVGLLSPTPGLVDQYFNDSTGEGDYGEKDLLGPWNDGGT